MADTSIEWTDATWNPVAGCKPVSPGCANCYAQAMTGRLEAMGQAKYAGLTRPSSDGKRHLFTGEFREYPDDLGLPIRWKKPRKIFVNSMSDLFGEGVSDEFIAAVFGVMAACPQHIFQVLTKRAGRMARWFEWISDRLNSPFDHCVHVASEQMSPNPPKRYAEESICRCGGAWPLPNVWLGVSVERQVEADERVPYLLDVPNAVPFLSCEPLLGPLDLRKYLDRVKWVIVGGESGPNARPMHIGWVQSIRDQCQAAGVPFFFKQWGAVAPVPVLSGKSRWLDPLGRLSREFDPRLGSVVSVERVGKKAAGRLLDGRTWDEMPEVRG